MAKARPNVSLHGKVWVAIDDRPAMTDAGADLLEQIDGCGSLSDAARRLRFAYRRTWLLVDGMNKGWPMQQDSDEGEHAHVCDR